MRIMYVIPDKHIRVVDDFRYWGLNFKSLLPETILHRIILNEMVKMKLITNTRKKISSKRVLGYVFATLCDNTRVSYLWRAARMHTRA